MTSQSNDQNRSRREFGQWFDRGSASVLASEFSSRSSEGRTVIARQKAIVQELQKSGRIRAERPTRDARGRFTGRARATERGKAFAFTLAKTRSEQAFRASALARTPRNRLTTAQQATIIMLRIFYG